MTMTMTVDVLVVGTEPPCPRCDLLYRLVSEIAAANPAVKVRHCAFDSQEAITLGRKVGRKIGTAKHVAKEAGVVVDWNAVYEAIDRRTQSVPPDARPADTWSPALDALLEPCRAVAERVGYFMTPILVIDGCVRHHGNVPPKALLDQLVIK
jgi:hypothetical protein